MVDCALPLGLALQDEPQPVLDSVPSILSVFSIDELILQSDRTSLDLIFLLRARGNNHYSHCWNSFRSLIEAVDFDTKPEAYCATCLCIVMWTGYFR